MISIFTVLLFCKPLLHSQENNWFNPIFLEGSAIHYYLPELFSGLITPEPGFRAALGYEYRRFRFAVESGYTHISGNNPMVLDIVLIPMTAKVGYHLPLIWGFGVQADLSGGVFISQTKFYPSAIDMLLENVQDEQVISPLAGARLYLTYTFLFGMVKLYAGGGVDVILESEGPIPPSLIEAGVSIKPLLLIKSSSKKSVNGAYFQINSAQIIDLYNEKLDEAGRRMQEKSSLRLTLRTYTPPQGDIEWQVRRKDGTPALSAARAGYCVEYLREKYGIDSKRIKIEYKDAGKASEEAQREIYRCVEIIIR
jgi:outer membrane protein OmpA-like peptidoglycan-associated protein